MGFADGGVGRRAVEEDIAALSARYRRDVREDGNFSRTGLRKLPIPQATGRVSGADGLAIDTRISREPRPANHRAVFSSTTRRWCFVLFTRRVIEFVGG